MGDSDPEISLIGAYTILQDRVFLDGLDFFETVVDGSEICRRYFEDGPYLFGSPTTHMYRMRDVKSRSAFFDEEILFEDADAAARLLLDGKLGFVHQTLTFVRTSNDSISTRRETFDIDALTRRVLLERYGRRVLGDERFEKLSVRLDRRHHRVLGRALLLGMPPEFWEMHTERPSREGVSIRRTGMLVGAAVVIARWAANPEDTLRALWRWRRN